MLSSTASFNSFYIVSKGIRHATLLNFSKAKLLLPLNLLKVNKTYFNTGSKNFFDIFSSHFYSQQQQKIEHGKVLLTSIFSKECKNSNILLNITLSIEQDITDALTTAIIYEPTNFDYYVLYLYAMNEEFFVKIRITLYKIDSHFYDSEETFNTRFKVVTLYENEDDTISNINYVGYFVVATNDKVLKEEDFQRMKISL
jgi:hypothetical protein